MKLHKEVIAEKRGLFGLDKILCWGLADNAGHPVKLERLFCGEPAFVLWVTGNLDLEE